MKQQKLSVNFIAAAVRTAMEFEGVYDLMKMWEAEDDHSERVEIIADIQDMIDDCSETESGEVPYIKFTDLDKIAHDVQKFKDNLRVIVDQKGGIGELSKLTGIPQPSLSRFFASASMPRRTTLLKIARALKLDAVAIATEWSR
jgi:hypothetical protein